MSGWNAVAAGIAACLFVGSTVQAQTPVHYRDYALGGNLASVSTAAGVPASDAKTLRSLPAVLQELQWRRPYTLNGVVTAADPVQTIGFSFYNDQLFRLVIDYDRNRTEGMTEGDMVDAISELYGPALASTAANRLPAFGEDFGPRVARWGNADYTAVLYKSPYADGFRMIVSSVPLYALAQTAEAAAQRTDVRDAPRRERARLKKEADDARAAQETARLANKTAFKP
jgi:hypothetical protein